MSCYSPAHVKCMVALSQLIKEGKRKKSNSGRAPPTCGGASGEGRWWLWPVQWSSPDLTSPVGYHRRYRHSCQKLIFTIRFRILSVGTSHYLLRLCCNAQTPYQYLSKARITTELSFSQICQNRIYIYGHVQIGTNARARPEICSRAMHHQLRKANSSMDRIDSLPPQFLQLSSHACFICGVCSSSCRRRGSQSISGRLYRRHLHRICGRNPQPHIHASAPDRSTTFNWVHLHRADSSSYNSACQIGPYA